MNQLNQNAQKIFFTVINFLMYSFESITFYKAVEMYNLILKIENTKNSTAFNSDGNEICY